MEMNTNKNYALHYISGSIPDNSLFLDMIQMPSFFFFFFFLASIVPKTEFMFLDSARFIYANGQLFLWFCRTIRLFDSHLYVVLFYGNIFLGVYFDNKFKLLILSLSNLVPPGKVYY